MQNRKPISVGNWKMHGSRAMVDQFMKHLKTGMALFQKSPEVALLENLPEIVICPPAPYLHQVQKQLSEISRETKVPIQLGAQNAYCENEGAYTGEISPSMLYDLDCRYVILGHSERRQLFGEDDTLIARKCQAAYDAGLIPILCVGETKAERDAGKTFEVISRQLQAVLGMQEAETFDAGTRTRGLLSRLILAYEPVWAIGTGLTATPEQAEEVHRFLRDKIAEFDATLAAKLRILYGGSVKANNAQALFKEPNIDGGLMGGASLKAEDFLDICLQAAKAKGKKTM